MIDYSKEISVLDSSELCKDRLMIFSLYCDFCKLLESQDVKFINKYKTFLSETFEHIASLMIASDKVFMKIYLDLLINKDPYDDTQFKNIVNYFKERLVVYKHTSDYVSVIDKYNKFNFKEKATILSIYSDLANNFITLIGDVLDENKSVNLISNLLNSSTIKLDNYLCNELAKGTKNEDIINNLRDTISVYLKNHLFLLYKNHKFSIEDVTLDGSDEFLSDFSKEEKDVWIFGLIYLFAGYKKDDHSKDDEKLDEMCKFLNVSPIKYKFILLKMSIHSIISYFKTKKYLKNIKR